MSFLSKQIHCTPHGIKHTLAVDLTRLQPSLTIKQYSVLAYSYLRASPACRGLWHQSRPAYETVTSFLKSMVMTAGPRFAMFGPGMEQLDISWVTTIMDSPNILTVTGVTQRQINGQCVCLPCVTCVILSRKEPTQDVSVFCFLFSCLV